MQLDVYLIFIIYTFFNIPVAQENILNDLQCEKPNSGLFFRQQNKMTALVKIDRSEVRSCVKTKQMLVTAEEAGDAVWEQG